MKSTKAVVFTGKDRIAVETVLMPIVGVGAGPAVLRITAAPICGTDGRVVRGEHPVKSGLISGHDPVGVIVASLAFDPDRERARARQVRPAAMSAVLDGSC